MNETIQIYLNQILTVLGSFAVAYLTMYIAKAKAKLAAEVDKIADDKARDLLDAAISRIDNLVLKGVNSAEQTLILDIKKQIAEGTATKQNLLDIGKNVADTVYSQLSKDTVATLNLEMNDLSGYIVSSVEAQILTLKNATVITQVVSTDSAIADKTTTTVIEGNDPVVVNVVSQEPIASVETVQADNGNTSHVELGVL